MEASMPSALEIIANVTATADNVCVNKNQCKRLAERFSDIGKALEVSKAEHIGDGSPALDQILTVLKKGQALVHDYADERKALHNVLYRADNIEAFKEVHGDIDSLGIYLDLGRTEETTLLNSDAATDRQEIVDRAHELILNDIPNDSGSVVSGNIVEGDVENMEKAVTEKCYNPESSPEDRSYLNIRFSAIHLYGAIKELKPLAERKTQADAHLAGLALVQKGRWNGCECAIKEFKSTDVHWNTQELHKEIASLVKLRHPHVTQLIGCSEHDNKTYVLYEMMDSDLRTLIDSRMEKKGNHGQHVKKKGNYGQHGPYSRTEEVSIITQIARGMFYLHEKGLVHGELKCTNLLVKERGEHLDVKVADFHCSRELGKTPTSKYKPAHRPRWMPPEDFPYYSGVDHPDLEHPTDDLLMKGDVYSFAMTCYEVVTGKYPFDGISGKALDEKIKAGDERPELPENLSKNLKSLIAKCWHKDPEQRPSFQDICYVLNVDAVHLMSQVEKLLRFFGFGQQEPAGDVLAGQRWDDIFPEVNELKAISSQRIDDAAKSLPHYMKIKPSDLKPARPLGSGASAEVYEARWIGLSFAVKWLKVEHVVKLRKEVSIMMTLLHPHVVRLVGFSVLFNRCAIVMELLDMSLRDLMDKRIKASKDPKHHIPFTELESLAIITKLALGMNFLHSRGVTHGDLKCANVLVRNEHLKSRMDVKIVDFGLSQLLSSPEELKVVGRGRAPEVIKRQVGIDLKAADVYSFAMTCYEVITGKMPFFKYPDKTAEAVAVGGGTPKFDDGLKVRRDLKPLLKRCWALDPQHRPKFETIVEELSRMS